MLVDERIRHRCAPAADFPQKATLRVYCCATMRPTTAIQIAVGIFAAASGAFGLGEATRQRQRDFPLILAGALMVAVGLAILYIALR